MRAKIEKLFFYTFILNSRNSHTNSKETDHFYITVRCTTFLKGLENEFNGHVWATKDTLPNDSYHYEDQLCQFSEFEMHAFTKMNGFLDFPLFYYRKQQKIQANKAFLSHLVIQIAYIDVLSLKITLAHFKEIFFTLFNNF